MAMKLERRRISSSSPTLPKSSTRDTFININTRYIYKTVIGFSDTLLVFQEVIRSSTRNQTIIVVLSYQVRVEQYQVRALDAVYLTRTVNIAGGDEVIEKFLRWVKVRAADAWLIFISQP